MEIPRKWLMLKKGVTHTQSSKKWSHLVFFHYWALCPKDLCFSYFHLNMLPWTKLVKKLLHLSIKRPWLRNRTVQVAMYWTNLKTNKTKPSAGILWLKASIIVGTEATQQNMKTARNMHCDLDHPLPLNAVVEKRKTRSWNFTFGVVIN